MQLPSASELLNIWEQGLPQPSISWTLTLLSAVCPEYSWDEISKLPIGQRDTHLLLLREQVFGSRLASVVDCPQCSDRLELNFNVSDIRVIPEVESDDLLHLDIDDYQVQFRLPNSLDLETIVSTNPIIAQQRLLERCLIEAQHQCKPQPVQDLPESIIHAVLQRMEQLDPQADVQLAIACPACGYQWQAIFDIVRFFWAELNAWALRILQEVHLLASAYSWHEADILAMSPQRRQIYLEMIGR